MPGESSSFSTGRKWGIFLSVMLSIAAVAALTGMINYLGARHFARFYWNPQTRKPLSAQTLGLLHSLTNNIRIIAYYDKTDSLYPLVINLLSDYQLENPRISVQVVDYVVDAAAARKVQAEYKLGSAQAKNLVIVAFEHRQMVLTEMLLAKELVTMKPAEDSPGMLMERQLQAFNGEMFVSAAIYNVCNPTPASAYFLQGHGEHSPENGRDDGYEKFRELLAQSNVRSGILNLAGTNDVPADCNLLVIAGPQKSIPRDEADKVGRYLAKGGRLFALFNYTAPTTGLETLLEEWNIKLDANAISDPDNAGGKYDMYVSAFNTNHPVSSPLLGFRLRVIQPRSVQALNRRGSESQDGPKPTVLATTGPRALVSRGGSEVPAGSPAPLITVAEKGNVKGAFEGGTTRIVVCGDSVFLANNLIDAEANSDFAGLAINWLLDQTRLMSGIGPHRVQDPKLAMTHSQMRRVEWIFLAAMPGAILLLGGLVWLRRRH